MCQGQFAQSASPSSRKKIVLPKPRITRPHAKTFSLSSKSILRRSFTTLLISRGGGRANLINKEGHSSCCKSPAGLCFYRAKICCEEKFLLRSPSALFLGGGSGPAITPGLLSLGEMCGPNDMAAICKRLFSLSLIQWSPHALCQYLGHRAAATRETALSE